jgi:hypothetical protein
MRVIILYAVMVLSVSLAIHSQECHYVHPPPPPEASDFPQPPSGAHVHFLGPVIRPFQVRCWYSEPSTPSKCVGGIHGTQKVTAFVPVNADKSHIDRTFRQTIISSFSAGGKTSDFRAENMPPGIFISFKGHPIFAVSDVKYPAENQESRISGQRESGVTVQVDFEHEPTNGECYLYLAVWVSVQ